MSAPWLSPDSIRSDKTSGQAVRTNGETRRIMNRITSCLITVLLLVANAQADDLNADLLAAASTGNTRRITELLGQGATTDARNKDGWTPLIFAAKAGHRESVEVLLANGADANAHSATKIGSTVLCFAVEGGNLKVLEALLAHKADVNGKSRNGMTPLNYAAGNGKL